MDLWAFVRGLLPAERGQFRPANAERLQEKKLLQDSGNIVVVKFGGFIRLEPRFVELTPDWLRMFIM